MNQQKPSPKRTIIISFVVIAIALLAYFYFSGSAPADNSTLASSPDRALGAVGSQVLGLLNQIQSLRIDTSLFRDPGYQTLRDYSVTIPAQNVGRVNPFAPLPGLAAPKTTR